MRADFFHYDRGVYSYSSEPERGQLNGDYTLAGYHSVKLIGWGVENGEEYWVKFILMRFIIKLLAMIFQICRNLNSGC